MRLDPELEPEPDIDRAPRKWCPECFRRTLFTRDMDGMPICREHTKDEVEHV